MREIRNTSECQFSLRAVLILVAIVAAILGAAHWALAPTPFDAGAWKEAKPLVQRPRTVRSDIVDHRLAHYDFHGWSRQQVVELLGEPDNWSGFSQWDMIYVLGLERSWMFALDDEALGFKFDANDRVFAYGLSVN